MSLQTLPFYGLTNIELTDMFLAETNRLQEYLKENNFTKYLLRTVPQELTNEQKTCFYYDVEELNKQTVNLKPSQCLSVMHLNIRSLDKHFNKLVSLIESIEFNFDVIALSEIGRKNIKNRAAILERNYNCYCIEPTDNNFGGVALLTQKHFNISPRPDLNFGSNLQKGNVECLWYEICKTNNDTSTNFIIGLYTDIQVVVLITSPKVWKM